MAEELEPKVAAAYRELGAEEPPRALDESILAASRRPARPWTQRWAVPLSLAAVMVLSVTVTLRIQQEAPELPSTVQQKPAAVAEAVREEAATLKLKPEVQIKSRARAAETPAEMRPAEKAQAPRAEPKAFADAPASATSSVARNDAARMEAASRDLAEARREMARSAEPSASGSALGRIEDRTARDAEAAARAPQAGALLAKRRADQPAPEAASAPPAAPPVPQAVAKPAPAPAAAPAAKLAEAARQPAETPEREFERIVQLRAEGRHEEADKAFLEFRRRYPNFRITEDMLRRVERPQGAR